MKAHREAEHNRTQFQIDRVAFFSDAVIAIALTLMVLEIKIPEMGKNATIPIIVSKYGWIISVHVIALFVMFSTIGNLWIRHHQLFEHIVNYNQTMIRINLYFLFSVMLLPISIQFLFARNEPIHFQLLCYFSNLSFSSLSYALLLRYIFLKKNDFSSIRDNEKISKLKMEAYLQCSVFILTTILIAIQFNWFYLAFLLFPAKKIFKSVKTRLAKRNIKPPVDMEIKAPGSN
jgi:uncharacterized membrane protein